MGGAGTYLPEDALPSQEGWSRLKQLARKAERKGFASKEEVLAEIDELLEQRRSIAKLNLAPNIRGDREYVQHPPFRAKLQNLLYTLEFGRRDYIQVDSPENILKYVQDKKGIVKKGIKDLNKIFPQLHNAELYLSGQYSVQQTEHPGDIHWMNYLYIHVLSSNTPESVKEMLTETFPQDKIPNGLVRTGPEEVYIRHWTHGHHRNVVTEFIQSDNKNKLFDRDYLSYMSALEGEKYSALKAPENLLHKLRQS